MSYEDKFLAGGDPHADRYHSTKNIREVGQHDMKKSIELYTERAAMAQVASNDNIQRMVRPPDLQQ